MTKQCPEPDEREQPEPELFFRSEEADRLRRVTEWFAVARGEAPTANLPSEPSGI